MELKGYKRGTHLFFERDGKQIAFDFRDLKFYRPLKRGDMKELKGTNAFFRKLEVSDVAASFNDATYAELIRKVYSDRYRYGSGRVSNFGTIFANVEKYIHLESYLLLDIQFDDATAFKNPANQFPKEVLEFMKESQIEFEQGWERAFNQYPDLVTNLCTYVRKNHYLDLEVYRMLYKMVRKDDYYSNSLRGFKLLTDPFIKECKVDRGYGNRRPTETPYGCEYKTLFSYLVRIHRTEACDFSEALTLYKDYLKMTREIERHKVIARRRELNPALDVATVGYENYNKIEKYPRYLKTRHDIVQKNYSDWDDDTDESEFKQRVEHRYEYSWNGYRIVTPKTANDVKAEGTNLHHCVASYISRIMDGTTQIVFLRKSEDESLVTVEIRAGAIVQARGYNNRNVTEAEVGWLKTFAKAKNLSYKDVKRDENMPTPPVVALQKWDVHNATLVELGMLVKSATAK